MEYPLMNVQKFSWAGLAVAFIGVMFALVQSAPAAPKIGYFDSVTGYAIQRDSTKYQPVSGPVEIDEQSPFVHRFLLDPMELPRELQSDYIVGLHRPVSSVMLGFVVDDAGRPLEKVRVSSAPSGVEVETDARGFFQIDVPVGNPNAEVEQTAGLIFEKAGYQTFEKPRLPVWPNGDCILQISLQSGGNKTTVSTFRPVQRVPQKMRKPVLSATASAAKGEPVVAAATSSTNQTLRIPRTIRVLQQDGVTIDYISMESYVKHSLPHEWPATWAQFSGSLEAFKAGAVAGRSYAVARLNNASASATYDICSTTSCQVYDPGATYSTPNTAVDQTTGYVVTSGAAISSSEYSAENNSSGYACGDGYTSPTGGCISDPVCTGQTRSGHGRGMCQWGTLRWGTGLKYDGNWTGYPGNGTSGVQNGYPTHDWLWMVAHYYPNLTLIQATPLQPGDDVKMTATRDVRMNSDGSISNATTAGINCPLVTQKSSGAKGVILASTPNPVWVTSDGRGYTWYKIQWSDDVIGWSSENWLERVFVPTPPTNLSATAASSTRINLTWSDNSTNETGFKIDQATASGGPWTTIATVGSNVTSYADTGLSSSTTYYYRVKSSGLGGDSANSNVASASTGAVPPVLSPISNMTIAEGSLLRYTNSATVVEDSNVFADFESFASGAQVMFRAPTFSGSTSANLNTTPNVAQVTDTFAAGTGLGGRVLNVNWSFNAAANPWLRLTTASATGIPNPVIDFRKSLRFDIWTDKSLKVAVGCRETTNATGTIVGSDGGNLGVIEWAGASGLVGAGPSSTRTVPTNSWTTLTFNLPQEPITSFVNGDNILSTVSGLGVLEHLAFTPAGGTGAYNVFLDNFAVVIPKTLTYSLDVGAPTGASINSSNGVFTWTPSETQGPGPFNITVRVTDNSAPPLSDTKTFTVTVNEVNQPPVLSTIANRTIHAGTTLMMTNSATDPDSPANILKFSLDPGAPAGASINTNSGVLTWSTGDAQAGTTNPITVRCTDNGAPSLSNAKTFNVTVLARPAFQKPIINGNTAALSWSAIPGSVYRVQWKTNLEDANWNDLVDVTAPGASASVNDSIGTNQRFYRILSLN